jgi:hypothetical protein
MVMRNLIKRILIEGVELQLDKVINILLKKYPNPMEDIRGGMEYLKEIGFEDDEIGKVFKHYFKTEKPSLKTYYQVFDGIFQPDDIQLEFETIYGVDEDGYEDIDKDTSDETHMIFNMVDQYGDAEDYQIMNWYGVGYWDDNEQGRIMNTTKAPYLDIDRDYLELLNVLFGSKWKGPFKIWFEDRFNLKVKTIG